MDLNFWYLRYVFCHNDNDSFVFIYMTQPKYLIYYIHSLNLFKPEDPLISNKGQGCGDGFQTFSFTLKQSSECPLSLHPVDELK